MPRTKAVTMDGATYTIGALTLNQVDEYIKPIQYPDNIEQLSAEEATKARSRAGVNKGAWLIVTSLNNVETNTAWDIERVHAEMDLLMFKALQTEILIFSGLRAADAIAGEPAPGETQAASVN